MGLQEVDIIQESESRYLTYALSVVTSRALPDVRDGLKPVHRRILFNMANDQKLLPNKPHRKSASVVGDVLAKYHPHGDTACYDALVRMAQDFSMRYPLIDGQGNFGSLDGDSAAAYRYTEARLRELALEVVGEIGEETVEFVDNFDQRKKEPVVLPSRVPNLLINGSSGIAVGMATSIPPHNLAEVVSAVILTLKKKRSTTEDILEIIEGPDFPTACSILNTKEELLSIYTRGKGAIRMRADYEIEQGERGRPKIVFTSIPYAVDKSSIVAKIADLALSKKLWQIYDVRDESTDEIRIVVELKKDSNHKNVVDYLFKNTPLQTNFNVNLNVLVPDPQTGICMPRHLGLLAIVQEFGKFRIEVTTKKLQYEKRQLEARIHLLDGLMIVCDDLDTAIKIVRASSGRFDAATKLMAHFKLTEIQAYYVTDLRIYQLARTAIEEVKKELEEKKARVAEINDILSSEKKLTSLVVKDLNRIKKIYEDERRSKVYHETGEIEIDETRYIEKEDAWVLLSKDGWIKRIKSTQDPESTRLREGDELLLSAELSTVDGINFISNHGLSYSIPVHKVPATTGYGEPVQKLFSLADGEKIISYIADSQITEHCAYLIYNDAARGFVAEGNFYTSSKRGGKRIMKLGSGESLVDICPIIKKYLLAISSGGYGVLFEASEVSVMSGASKGVILSKLSKGEKLVKVLNVDIEDKFILTFDNQKERDFSVSDLAVASRAKRGLKIFKRGSNIVDGRVK